MNGNLTERQPGVWRLRVYIGRDTQGRVRNASRTFRGNKGDAHKALRRFIAEVEQSRTPDRNATVAMLLDRWLDHVTPERSLATMREHRRSVTKNIVPELGALKLSKLTPAHLDATYTTWVRRGLSPASVRRQHAVLSAALGQAVKWDMLDRNPALRATPPGRHAAPLAQAITVAEMRALIVAAEAREPVIATAVALAALTGCRRGELCALRWSDVDLNLGTVSVARAITVIGKRTTEGDTKTHQARKIALDPVAIAVLEQRRDHQLALAAQAGTQLAADPWILSRRADGGYPCLPDGLTHAFSALCVSVGLVDTAGKPRFRFHDLRHFSATTAIASGADARTVASRLGHADPSITLKTYAHAVAQRDRDIAGVLGAAVGGGAG